MKTYSVDWIHHLPQYLLEILELLEKSGIQAYLVGGAVRDLWLGKKPKDYDLVSDASPDQIEALFPKTLAIGKKFGIIAVVTSQATVEIARFRTDGAYTDQRHPNEVIFSNPEEDAARRDFTINGLFYDDRTKLVIDYVGGVDDLKSKILRTVGNPELRFSEDALRMLRAFRFYSQLGDFQFAPEVLPAIDKMAAGISRISRERFSQEFLKLLAGPGAKESLVFLKKSNLWRAKFPGSDIGDLSQELLTKFQQTYQQQFSDWVPNHFLVLLLAIFPKIEWSSALLLEKNFWKAAENAVALCAQVDKFSTLSVDKQKILLADPGFALSYCLAFVKTISAQQIENLALLLQQRNSWIERGKLNPPPLLRGSDLIAAGYRPGPKIQDVLESLREAQLKEEVSTKEEALVWLKNK